MTPEEKQYYSNGLYPLFELMSQEHNLTLLDSQMHDIINCVRKMDEASKSRRKMCKFCNHEITDKEIHFCKFHEI